MQKANLSDKSELVTRVAVMRYKLDFSQAEIARRLGVSTMTVSRLLERALRDGIVSIRVNTPVSTDAQLEESLKLRYKLREALVVKTGLSDDPTEAMARAAAFYLDLVISPGDVLGIAGGRTLMRVMPHMKLPAVGDPSELELVQLAGGFSSPAAHNPLSTLNQFASHFGFKGYFLQLPIYAPTSELCAAMHSHYLAGMEERWRRCTICLSGVGISGPDSVFRQENVMSQAEMNELEQRGAVGDIFGRWFDARGSYLDHDINRRVISVSPDILDAIPRKILISRGEERVKAVRAVLSMNIFNMFITDEPTARQLVSSN